MKSPEEVTELTADARGPVSINRQIWRGPALHWLFLIDEHR
jgi:hypothetical protein